MFYWIMLEIKQMLFTRKNMLLFALVLASSIMTLSLLSNDKEILSQQLASYGLGEIYTGSENEDKIEALINGDIEEYNKLLLIDSLKKVNENERYLLSLDINDGSSLEEKINSYYRLHDQHQKLKSKIYKKYNFKDSSEKMSLLPSIYNSQVSHLNFEYEVFDKDFLKYDIASSDSLTSSVYLYNTYFKFLVILIPLIVGFDTFSNDKKQGSIRSVLSLNQKREKYYIVKFIATLITSLIILLLPIIIAFTIYNKNIIKDFTYPAFIYKDGLFSFSEINPFINKINNNYISDMYSISSQTPYLVNEFGVAIGIAEGIELMSLGHLLFYSVILIVFLTTLILSIQIAVSINSNKFVGFFLTAVVILLLLYLSNNKNLVKLETDLYDHYIHVPKLLEKTNAMSYFNVIKIVEGSIPFTFLQATCVLSFESVIFSLIGIKLFNRKDIKS